MRIVPSLIAVNVQTAVLYPAQPRVVFCADATLSITVQTAPVAASSEPSNVSVSCAHTSAAANPVFDGVTVWTV